MDVFYHKKESYFIHIFSQFLPESITIESSEKYLMNDRKTNYTKIGFYIRLLSLVLLLASFFCPFATGLRMTVKSSSSEVISNYGPAFSFLFGGNLVSEHVTYQNSAISVLPFVSFLLLCLGFILLLVSLIFVLKKKRIPSIILATLSAVIVLIAGIMLLCSHRQLSDCLADAIIGEKNEAVRNTIYEHTSLQFGILGTGIFSIFSSIGIFVSFFVDGTMEYFKSLLNSKF